jgi:hypothetical protein
MRLAKVYMWSVSAGSEYKLIALSSRQSEIKMGRFLEAKLGMPNTHYVPLWFPQYDKGIVKMSYEEDY